MGERDRGARALVPAEIAWVGLIPCALLAVVAIVMLGPPLGHLLFAPDTTDPLWPPGWIEAQGRAEPVELGRYLVAAAAPLLLSAVVLVGAARGVWLPAPAARALVLGGQLLLLAFLVLAVLGQHDVLLVDRQQPHVFGVGALAVAALLVLAAVLALRHDGIRRQLGRLARETPRRRALGLALASAVAATWMLEGLMVDGLGEDQGVFAWTLNDAFAVLDGRTPLVDYRLLYAKLLPYPAALAMAGFGTTALVYTVTMTLLSVLTLLAVYAIFRRVTRSSLPALGLFVPFVALGDVDRTMALTAMWPMRYGGAYLMAWLAARRLDDVTRRVWPLYAVGAVVAVDDLEFGIAALGASVVALACVRPPRSPRAVLRLAAEVAGGVLAGLALVALLTLLHGGALPNPALLMEWPRIFTRLGWFSLPMPRASLHLALYATFAAALVAAAVRLARRDADALLTGMLVWSGVFGLLAGGYYAGRSDDVKLVSMFSAWGFALALLAVAAVRALAARGWRAPTLPELLVLFGLALGACSVIEVTPPQEQIERLADAPPPAYRPVAEQFVREVARRGQKVAILMPMGHRIAYELGLDNVSPYATPDALVTRGQLQHVIDAARRERAHEIILLARLTAPEHLAALARAGFRIRARSDLFLQLADR